MAEQPKLRILALHGWRTSGKILQAQARRSPAMLAADTLTELTA